MRERTIEVEGYIVIVSDCGGGTIVARNDPRQGCSECNDPDCIRHELDAGRLEEEVMSRRAYNHAIDGIEALILSLACAGVDIETEEFKQGIRDAIAGCANNL
jgi:hypothetical protein